MFKVSKDIVRQYENDIAELSFGSYFNIGRIDRDQPSDIRFHQMSIVKKSSDEKACYGSP